MGYKVCCILILFFFGFVQPISARPYGPLWKVWTHSREVNECNAKTSFWFVLGIVGTTLVMDKLDRRYNGKLKDRIALTPEGVTIYWKK